MGVLAGLAVALACLGTARADAVAAQQQDPIEFLAKLAKLPPQQQDAILHAAGNMLKEKNPQIDCNVFGGKAECKNLPKDSNFGRACAADRQDLSIDCIYYRDAEKNMELDPEVAMSKVLGADYARMKGTCPQCMENLQALWCIQVIPECGSFKEHVHEAIFPAAVAVKKAEDAGQPKQIAMAAAVPGLVKAMLRTMACREMCQATVNTCSCQLPGKPLTFGEALVSAEKYNANFQEFHPGMAPSDIKDLFFQGIWNTPLCELFTSKDDPAFEGTCDADVLKKDGACDDASFCNGLDPAKKVVTESVIAGQIARSVFGFIAGPASLTNHAATFGKATDHASKKHGYAPVSTLPPTESKDSQPAPTPPPPPPPPPPREPPASDISTSESTSSAHGGASAVSATASRVAEDGGGGDKRSKGSSVMTFFMTVLVMTIIGAVGFFAWKRYQDSRVHHFVPSSYEAIQEDGIPLASA